MKNILVFSGAISPFRGSEFSVGWNFVSQMSRENRLFVLYLFEESKKDIEYFLSKNTLTNVSFFFCGKKTARSQKMNIITEFYSFYKETKDLHKNVYEIAKKIISEQQIDVIHFLNPIGFKEPGYLWKLKKPYVWGPVQGVSNWPVFCIKLLSKKGWIEFILRRIFHKLHFLFNPRVKRAFRRADVVIAATRDSQEQINRRFHIQSLWRPENALLKQETSKVVCYNPQDGFLEIISVGTLNDRKCLKLLLYSLKEMKCRGFVEKIRLHVCGTGYLENDLKRFCIKECLNDIVIWHGQISRDEVQKLYSKVHLNVITSLSEATSTVLLEAMAKGVPTLTLKHCGMGSVLSRESSFLIEISSLKKIILDICDALVSIIENPDLIEKKSRETLVLGKKFLWSEQVKFFNGVYETAIKRFEQNVYQSIKEN